MTNNVTSGAGRLTEFPGVIFDFVLAAAGTFSSAQKKQKQTFFDGYGNKYIV